MGTSRVDVTRRYLARLQVRDGAGAAALFTDDGVLDDGNGGHHAGRAAITAFIGGQPDDVELEAPLGLIEDDPRVVVYGRIGSWRAPGLMPFRWIFQFVGDQIAHLGNSRLPELPTGLGGDGRELPAPVGGPATRSIPVRSRTVTLSPEPGVVSDVVEGKAVLVDPAGRELITLNDVGTLVWEALDGRRDVADLCGVVTARYPSAPRLQIEADVRAFLDELSRLGLLSERVPGSD